MPPPDTTGAEVAGDQSANREGTNVTETGPFGTEETSSEQPVSNVSEGILDRLGVPEEIAKQIGLGQKAEAQPEPEVAPEGEPEAEQPEPEAEPEPEPELELGDEAKGEEKPNKTWTPEVQAEFNKRVGKLTKQRETEKSRAETAEAERDALKEQIAATPPVQIQPTEDNPLAGVETQADLARAKQECEWSIRWANKNKDGCLGRKQDGTEFEITAEKVAEIKEKAEFALRQIPDRKDWIRNRAEADQAARAVSPRIFEKGTIEYQVGQAILQEIPSLADHPGRNLILTDYMSGLGMRLAREEQARQQANGANTAPVKTANSPNPLTRKIPPVAQHVARTSSAPVRTGTKQVDDAMNNVVASGGDRAAIAAAFRAIKSADKQSGSKRAPAPV